MSRQMLADLFLWKLDHFKLQKKIGLALNCKCYANPIVGQLIKGCEFLKSHSHSWVSLRVQLIHARLVLSILLTFSGGVLAPPSKVHLHPKPGQGSSGLLPRSCRRLQHSKVLGNHLGRPLRGALRREPDSLSSDQPTHGPHLHQHLRDLDVPRLHVHRPLRVAGHPQHAHLPRDPASECQTCDVVKSGKTGT